ncbi:MAG: RNA 2',3'-cyclic phosphodiesterase [archaeon]
MTHRLFVAIRIKPNSKIRELIQYLKKFPSTKTVEEENLHVNLKFLGDVRKKEIKKSKEALKELKNFSAFKINLQGIGAFPNQGYIKVIWIGVKSPEIEELAEKIEEKYVEKGFEQRKRTYKPHVTIARVKTKPNQRIGKIFKEFDKEYMEIQANEVELIESELTPKGPVYKTIEKIRMG